MCNQPSYSKWGPESPPDHLDAVASGGQRVPNVEFVNIGVFTHLYEGNRFVVMDIVLNRSGNVDGSEWMMILFIVCAS